MARHFPKDRLILYLSLTIGFLVHWVHSDLTLSAGTFSVSLMNNFWQVIFVVGLNILYFEYALPFVTSRQANRFILVVSSIALQLVMLAVGLYAWRMLGVLLNIYHPFGSNAFGTAGLSDSASFVPGPFLVFAAVKLFFDYTQLKYAEQQVRLEKKQAELVFLKSQINPHFLFNTLNNIYSLSQYQPHLVSESVLRLSKILRYLLYETSSDLITVDKEIKVLNDYLDLERLRYSESVTIDFNSDVEDFFQMIPPLLLIPLVENAFKHGVSESRGKRFVHVTLTLKKRQLTFRVENSSDPASDDKDVKANIGLSNLRGRLNLLYKEFDFFTEQKNSVFTAVLKINLASDV